MTNSEKLQSSIAIFIATVALLISVWQGCEQRRHNRLSVRPLLNFETISYNNSRSIKLSNNGLGPAVIRSFVIDMDGKRYNADEANPWRPVIEARKLQGKFSSMYYFARTSIIKPEENFSLLTWVPDSTDAANLDISVTIEYSSLYEEDYQVQEDF